MTVALVGGLDRLSRAYRSAAEEHGFQLRHYTKRVQRMREKIDGVDCIILFTSEVSHEAVREATKAAKLRSIPVIRSHTGSVSALRRCLDCAGREECGRANGETREGL